MAVLRWQVARSSFVLLIIFTVSAVAPVACCCWRSWCGQYGRCVVEVLGVALLPLLSFVAKPFVAYGPAPIRAVLNLGLLTTHVTA